MRKKKQGRNTPCWCGSGKKYKFCHLNRDQQAPRKPWEISKEFRSAFSTEQCLAPNEWHESCASTIARAHTVPKSSSLKAIAKSGHVYGFVPSLENIQKNNGVIVPELVGVNSASTFTGFCSTHDNQIFAPVETRKFSGEPDQMFALSYRSLCREVYTKNASAETAQLLPDLDKGRAVHEQERIQMMSFLHNIGVSAGVRDNAHYKDVFDKMLVDSDYSKINGVVIYLKYPPPIMCSGSFYPEQDFIGTQLQDIADVEKTPEMISVTSFFDGSQGIVAFVWLEDSEEVSSVFMNSLLHLESKYWTDALIRLIFEHFENTLIAPAWWESLDDVQRDGLVNRMASSANPTLDRPASILADDGLRFEPWDIVDTQIVGATDVAL